MVDGLLGTKHPDRVRASPHRLPQPPLLNARTCDDCVAGYRQALQEAGIPYNPALITAAPYRPGAGGEAIKVLLAQDPKPTAVVAISNSVAQEALRALTECGLSVPQDIAIVAIGDTWLSLLTTPPLTSICQPLFEMGKQSVEMLLARITNPHQPPERIICPVSLVVRESTMGSRT